MLLIPHAQSFTSPLQLNLEWLEVMTGNGERTRQQKWREENIEHARELDRIKARRRAAAKNGIVLTDEELYAPKKLLLTEDEKREKRRVKSAKQRAENPDRIREITRNSMRKVAAEAAIAAGREPGKIGRPKQFTEEEQRAKRKAKTERHTAANLDEVREKARLRGAAKRAGTFVSKALPRLTEEERILSNRAWAARRRTMVREAGGTWTRDDIIRINEEQDGKCFLCATIFGDDGFHIDHWIPLARGGTNDPSNLRLLCAPCNLKKGAKLPEELGLVATATTEGD